jgi:hypothetical protein
LGVRKLVATISLALLIGLGGLAAADGPADKTPQRPRQREVLRERTSGFWTSNRPAEHGAYKWRLLAIGGGLLVVTGFVMWRLLRRANAARAAKPELRA